MILAIDPSSSCTGFAVLAHTGRVSVHGRIKAKNGEGTHRRVSRMIEDLRWYADQQTCSECVIESPSVQSRQRKANGESRAPFTSIKYVVAYGRILQAMSERMEVHEVTAREWTRGRPKAIRAETIKAIVPTYTGKGDSGMDEADAIGLGLWWCDQRRLRGAS